MFMTLVESGAQHVRSGRPTTISMIVHGAFISTAVALTATHRGNAATATMPQDAIVYIAPRPLADQIPVRHRASTTLTSAPPNPTRFVLPTITEVPNTITVGDLAAPPTPEDANVFAGHGIDNGKGAGALGTHAGAGAPDLIDAEHADRAPFVLGNPPTPRYPAILRESGTTGQVIARFTVDTLGHAEPASVTIVDATHPLFSDAVRNALPAYRFSPGEVGGRKVRTMVQMPFTFSIR